MVHGFMALSSCISSVVMLRMDVMLLGDFSFSYRVAAECHWF